MTGLNGLVGLVLGLNVDETRGGMKLSSISSIYSGSSESSNTDNNVLEITGLPVAVTNGALVGVENCGNLFPFPLNLSDKAPGNSLWGTILPPPPLLLFAKIFDLTLGADPGGLAKEGKLEIPPPLLKFSRAGSTVGAGSIGRLVGMRLKMVDSVGPTGD